MAYEIEFFCRFGGTPAEALDALVSGLAGQNILQLNIKEGQTWRSAELSRSGYGNAVLAEFHTRDDVTEKEVSFVSSRADAPDLSVTNSLLVITISGANTDWDLVHAIAGHARVQWSGIPCDEESGFSVSLG
jgi:hypothetical protein